MNPDDLMITTIQIDHREWRDWLNKEPDGAIGRLNLLLGPHDVELKVTSPPADWIDLVATSTNANIREQVRVISNAFNEVESQRDGLVVTVGRLRLTLEEAESAFVILHRKWLSAEKRCDMNEEMDGLSKSFGRAWDNPNNEI